MTGYNTAYQVACSPGPDAAAAMTRAPDGLPVLVVYLDPVNMTIQSQPTHRAMRDLSAFCRELAREATLAADELDLVLDVPRVTADGSAV
jgi:hypothetical protein